MASSWRSLLKEKIHRVLSRDKEIKEQFIERWQLTRDRLEQKVPHARCTNKRQRNKGARNSWKMTRDRAESVTCICMWSNKEDYYMLIDQSVSSCWLRIYPIQKFLMTYLTMKKIEFYEIKIPFDNVVLVTGIFKNKNV